VTAEFWCGKEGGPAKSSAEIVRAFPGLPDVGLYNSTPQLYSHHQYIFLTTLLQGDKQFELDGLDAHHLCSAREDLGLSKSGILSC
jgi:hypothetical protein